MEAVTALRAGRAVILPTDTVYGLCVLPEHAALLAELKGRPEDVPVATLYADVEAAPDLLPEARALLPGPYTFVVGGRGVRVPVLPPRVAEIIRAVGAVAATSANLHGRPDPCRLADVPTELREAAGAEIDGGELPGVPSTVVDLTGPEPIMLRAGAGPWPP
jgi:L-threonylcarbamoyladenylate synthase